MTEQHQIDFFFILFFSIANKTAIFLKKIYRSIKYKNQWQIIPKNNHSYLAKKLEWHKKLGNNSLFYNGLQVI